MAGGVDSLIAQLTAVVNVLAQGRAPASIAPVLAGAGLVALAKPAGGLRPIAVGELLRRLTGKCLMTLVREEARAFFWPAQVGVAVPEDPTCIAGVALQDRNHVYKKMLA